MYIHRQQAATARKIEIKSNTEEKFLIFFYSPKKKNERERSIKA